MEVKYYVTKKNSDGSEELLGFNLNEQQKDELFYSYTVPSGGKSSVSRDGSNASNSYGCHDVEIKSRKQAINELIAIPNEFNNAIKILKKHGFIAVPKDSILVSYQGSNLGVFKEE